MTTSIVIEELPIPADPDAVSFADYARALAVRNAHEAHVMGPAARYIDPVEALPAFQDQVHMSQRIFAGRLDGEIVAHGLLRSSNQPGTRIAWAFGEVLPNARRLGVGTALFDHVEGVAHALGRPVVQSFAMHEATAGGDRLPSPTGFGSLPLHDPGVRFLRGRAYELSQIQRMSLLHLPVPFAHFDALHREAKTFAGDAYESVTWVGQTPGHWLADLAVLIGRSETDAPRGALVNEPEEWDAERLRAEETRNERSGRVSLTAAAVYRPTGTLAGFTRLSVPTDRTQPARQHANDRAPGASWPSAGPADETRQPAADDPGRVPIRPSIVASNAEDNRHMLNINETIGFVPIAYGGAWKKILDVKGRFT